MYSVDLPDGQLLAFSLWIPHFQNDSRRPVGMVPWFCRVRELVGDRYHELKYVAP